MTPDAYPVARSSGTEAGFPKWRPIALAMISFAALIVGSTAAHLAVLPATGSNAVGRERLVLVDVSRPERHTDDPGDLRSVPVEVWYPAVVGTGTPAEYVDQLSQIADGLVQSGSLSRLEVSGLGLVRTGAMTGATLSGSGHPVLILSPGNQTNVAFYASIAEELASHGFLVIGVDHPFQVAATTVSGGSVAVYDDAADAGPLAATMAAKIEERVADLIFVLDALRSGSGPLAGFATSANLDRIGVLGHSNGGLAAFEMCRVERSVDACLNMDGQGAGGPLGHVEGSTAPDAPFLYLTKEAELHPVIDERFELASSPAVRAVLPDAAHDSFTDGPQFQPGFNPLTTSSQRVMTSIRSLTVAFFDHWLVESESRPYDGLAAPADVYINMYPLGERDRIPAGE